MNVTCRHLDPQNLDGIISLRAICPQHGWICMQVEWDIWRFAIVKQLTAASGALVLLPAWIKHLQLVSSPPVARLAKHIPCTGFCAQSVSIIQTFATNKKTDIIVAVAIIPVDQVRLRVYIPLLFNRDASSKTLHTSRWVSCRRVI